MTRPEPVHVELRVHDAVEAIRLVAALDAIAKSLWARFGHEMSEYLIEHPVEAPSDPILDDLDDELPF